MQTFRDHIKYPHQKAILGEQKEEEELGQSDEFSPVSERRTGPPRLWKAEPDGDDYEGDGTDCAREPNQRKRVRLIQNWNPDQVEKRPEDNLQYTGEVAKNPVLEVEKFIDS